MPQRASQPLADRFALGSISVVVPAYNERSRIGPTLDAIAAFLDGTDYELLVVNDGSTDGTGALVAELAAREPRVRLLDHPRNRGKGYAIRTGVMAARGDVVLFCDADHSTPIAELIPLLAAIEAGHQIAIGSRRMPGSQITSPQPLHRRLIGALFRRLVAVAFLSGFRDTQCGFKLFTQAAAKRIFSIQFLERFAFDVEVLYLARRLGYRVAEVPVSWADSVDSTVRPLAASWSMLLELVRMRLHYGPLGAGRRLGEAGGLAAAPDICAVDPEALPSVSVVIPVRNGERNLPECLARITAQDYPRARFEVILVDNGSTDSTAAIAERFDVRYLFEERPGVSAARNAGIRRARGEIILLMDGDCLAEPELIREHVAAHLGSSLRDPAVALVGGSIQGWNKNYWATCDDLCSWTEQHPKLAARYTRSHPTANLSFRRALIEADPRPFDEELASGEDFAFCTRAVRAGARILFHPGARVSHVNRTTLRELLGHAEGWGRSEYLLFKKGVKRPRRSRLEILAYFLGGLVVAVFYQVMVQSLRVGRLGMFLCLPYVVLSKVVYRIQILKADLRCLAERTAPTCPAEDRP